MIQLGTKAETLERIWNKLGHADVLPEIYFTVNQWKDNKESFWEQCVVKWGEVEVIVRSSAINEDTLESSQAGKFESIGNIYGKQAFENAVDKVIHSFDDDNGKNQILVQPMLQDVMACGVAFTLDPNSLGHYYVINYDESGLTSTVTSGNGHDEKLLYVFKGKEQRIEPDYINRLCLTLEQLEEIFGKNNLDVEFAVTKDGRLYVLQVRALCINGEVADYQEQYRALCRIEERIRRDASAKPYLCGVRNIYGVMPDWNPAEMIGIRPKALALSLYREMITDSVWAYQRDNYGYRNLRSFPLMVDFGGLPYIDVRVSFNSFVPAGLDEKTSNKLVDYYLERLAEEPAKHDKVEFDIVFSCYTLDLPERIQVLGKYGFSGEEIQAIISALRDMTNQIIHSDTGLWRRDYEKIKVLEERYKKVMESSMDETEKIYWLLEDCKRYGTLPFAGLARGAFIAVQLLTSMVKTGIISEMDYQNFMNDVDTVSSRMNHDFFQCPKEEFLKKYGHLRPGTYDINSMRYDEAPDLYFDWERVSSGEKIEEQKKKFSLSIPQMHCLKDMLEKSGLNNDILGLMDFIKTVIEGREYGKFVFTKSLSKILQMICGMGEKHGFNREDCAYLDIQAVRELYVSAKDVEEMLGKSISEGKEQYALTKTLVLPPVLVNPVEVWKFYYLDSEPNYITLQKAQGEIIVLDGNLENIDISGKIVLTACADPGFDWIFSHHISGFITMYGGANSHMAIRAGELGIPAAVGVGEKMYERYTKARMLEIDSLAKTIRIL